MAIRAVLFDLGNTLWHIPEPPPVDKVRQETVGRISHLLRSWGIEPEGEFFFLGRDIRLAVGEADQRAYETDCVSPDYVEIVRRVAAGKGLDLTRERAELLWHTWNLPGAFFRRRLFDGALETLAALRDRGYRLGLVTNRQFGGPAFASEFEDHGLAPFFEASAVSCHVGYLKPHPRIFQHALESLRVKPHEAVMVGDDLRADVGGARALGITAVWLRPGEATEQLDGVQPDYVVDALREVPQLPCFL